jgi:hypothetical protein
VIEAERLAACLSRFLVEPASRQFANDMKTDLKHLQAELGYARTKVLTSKEFVAATVTVAGTAASAGDSAARSIVRR